MMAMSPGASSLSRSSDLRDAPSTLKVSFRVFKYYLETEQFDAMYSNGDAETIYDTHNGSAHDTVLCEWSRRCALYGVGGAVL